MPSVDVQYKDAGALKFLKFLSGYIGFKVIERKTGAQECDSSKDRAYENQQHSFIPADDNRKYEAFLSAKNLDSSTLRRDLWKRS